MICDDRVLFLDHATVVRPGGEVVLHDIHWTIREGETWAITGPVGAGKTTLAETLLGRHHVASGVIGWPFLDRLRAAGRALAWPADAIRLVSFRDDSWLFSYARHYYQQRFNFVEPQDDRTLDSFLRAGSTASDDDIAAIARELDIDHLRALSFIKLSNGQARRARIARALLSRPALLILDDLFLGLDAVGREEVSILLERMIATGLKVLLVARSEVTPPWITHVLPLSRGRKCGRRIADSGLEERTPPVVRSPSPPLRGRRARGEGIGTDSTPSPPTPLPRSGGEGRRINPHMAPQDTRSTEPIIELRNVTVAYDSRPVLNDVSWSVHAGERWAVLGPNGSGKTTLLSLLCGDHPQAYANDIKLFGRQRGSGETIWEIKQKIGLVSPELHLYFSEPLTAFETAATGFFDILVRRPTAPAQDAIVEELFAHFDILQLKGRPFARLSSGEQRLVMVIRALLKSPPLLILDEPFQGLDARLIGLLRGWLDYQLKPEQTVLFVSHYLEELPRSVTRLLRLESGQAVEMR